MRLLNVHTGRLEEFYETNKPQYAILSHTWGDKEISFAQLHQPDVEQLGGYQKIRYTRGQATKDDLKYIWVDTCCIDKSSSAELSESINSMFRWYKDANVCYAYLEDVEFLDRDFRNSLETSKWFRRAFTLQELIAPRKVLFFDKTFNLLADKASLAERISKITLIPVQVIQGSSSPDLYSIAQRMSWASYRQATRREDVAYCLLGLFGINMPLLYGEGDRAFLRLQQEIAANVEDQSLFAWHADDGEADESSSDAFNWCFFAKSPSQFRKSAKIVAFSTRIDVDPVTMTNRGLRMQAPVLNHNGNSVIVLLACRDIRDPGRRIGVALRRLVAHMDVYCRNARYSTSGTSISAFDTLPITPVREGSGGLCKISIGSEELPIKTIYLAASFEQVQQFRKHWNRGWQKFTYLIKDSFGSASLYRISSIWPEPQSTENGNYAVQSHISTWGTAVVLYTHRTHPPVLVFLSAKFQQNSDTGWTLRACVAQDPPAQLLEILSEPDKCKWGDLDRHRRTLPDNPDLHGGEKVVVKTSRDSWDADLWHIDICSISRKTEWWAVEVAKRPVVTCLYFQQH